MYTVAVYSVYWNWKRIQSSLKSIAMLKHTTKCSIVMLTHSHKHTNTNARTMRWIKNVMNFTNSFPTNFKNMSFFFLHFEFINFLNVDHQLLLECLLIFDDINTFLPYSVFFIVIDAMLNFKIDPFNQKIEPFNELEAIWCSVLFLSEISCTSKLKIKMLTSDVISVWIITYLE